MASEKQSGNRPLFEVVQELLHTPAISDRHFRRLLNEQPALLGPETQALLNAIALAQTSATAKEQVQHNG